MDIILDEAKDIIVVTQQTVNSNIIKRGAVIDDESKKLVVALYSVGNSPVSRLILWQGDAYDAIGNWTYEQVDNRIKELL